MALKLVERAAAADYRVLEIAVDTAVSGYRVRDVRNGFTIPPSLTLGGLVDIGLRPRYWTGMLRSPSLEFANLTDAMSGGGYTIANITSQFDPAVSWDDIARIREVWPGKLLLKARSRPRTR